MEGSSVLTLGLYCLTIISGCYGAVTWTTPNGVNTVTVNLDEDKKGGDAVTSVVATTDVTAKAIASYTIVSQPAGDKFAIADATQGDITVSTGATFDYETTKSYIIEVKAADNADTVGSATVTITVNIVDKNDNDPTYGSTTKYTASFCSTATSGTVGTYTATDADGSAPQNTIKYSINSGDDASPDAKFSINEDSAVVTKSPKAFTTKLVYTLVIYAINTGATNPTASATLTVSAVATACSSAAALSGNLVAMGTIMLSFLRILF